MAIKRSVKTKKKKITYRKATGMPPLVRKVPIPTPGLDEAVELAKAGKSMIVVARQNPRGGVTVHRYTNNFSHASFGESVVLLVRNLAKETPWIKKVIVDELSKELK